MGGQQTGKSVDSTLFLSFSSLDDVDESANDGDVRVGGEPDPSSSS